MTEQRSLKQEYNGQTLEHVIVHDESGRKLPTVIIIPTVMGVQPLELGFAEKLVALGYHVVVADLFGRRFTPGVDKEAAFAAMGELRSDRAALRDRLLAVFEEVRKREHVDAGKIAVIGYCFGGQCALDVARSGADVAAAASFSRPVRSAWPAAAADQGQGCWRCMAGTTRWCRRRRWWPSARS